MIQEATKDLLGEMILLFDHLRDLARSTTQEIAVVFTTPNGSFAGSFDSTVAVENIAGGQIEDLQFGPLASECQLLTQVMRRDQARALALVLEPKSLFSGSQN